MTRRWIIALGPAALALALALGLIWQEGAHWRIPAERIYPSAKEMRAAESALCKGTDRQNGVALGNKANQPIITCSHDRGAEQDIYVWGDSHARHLLGGLVSEYPDHNIHILYFTSCLAQSGIAGYRYDYEGREAFASACVDRNARALAFFEKLPPTSVILHQYYGHSGQFTQPWYEATDTIIAALEARGHRVAFIGGVPRPGVAMGACLAVPAVLPDGLLPHRCRGDAQLAAMVYRRNQELVTRWPNHAISLNDVFCTTSETCRISEGAVLLFRDKHHLTLAGARRVIGAIKPRLSALLGT